MASETRRISIPRKVLLLLLDLLCFAFIDIVFYFVSSHFSPNVVYDIRQFAINSGILIFVSTCMRIFLGCYINVWRYTSTFQYLKLVLSDFISGIISLVVTYFMGLYSGIWHFLIVELSFALLTLCMRFCYRLVYKYIINRNSNTDETASNVAIIGAGQLGAYLVNDLKSTPGKYNPVMFIDIDRSKIGNQIMGLKIYSEDESIFEILKEKEIKVIIVALEYCDGDKLSHLYEFYEKSGCQLKRYELPVKDVSSEAKSAKKPLLRDFRIEDLLFRNQMSLDKTVSEKFYQNKVVLITGGGGSIGSEICRQIAKFHPKKLVIVDIYENNAYEIQQELIREYGDKLDLSVEIASVRDVNRLDSIFAYYRPQIVFHAAAHKHVPLMEHSACEAVRNNVLGTYNTANASEKYGVEKFILISTDKAVNPTNVMGASKRVCEMVIQCRLDSATTFAAVRFGNVLGSNGSVIPLFKRQIAEGGPVTITDKRIIRYFMTIPEASQLVIHAGTMANKGQLFVLDMGKPVRIYDLAVNMIKLSGYEPGKDIEIKEIGLRPGEKLYEELLMKNEKLNKTSNDMIFIEEDTPYSRAEVEEKIHILLDAAERSLKDLGGTSVREAIKSVVPTFREPEEVNKDAEKSDEMKNQR